MSRQQGGEFGVEAGGFQGFATEEEDATPLIHPTVERRDGIVGKGPHGRQEHHIGKGRFPGGAQGRCYSLGTLDLHAEAALRGIGAPKERIQRGCQEEGLFFKRTHLASVFNGHDSNGFRDLKGQSAHIIVGESIGLFQTSFDLMPSRVHSRQLPLEGI